MKICYLLDSTELWGGVRVVFDQARALRKRGHDVMIRAHTGDHSWYPYDIKIDYVDNLSLPFDTIGSGSMPDVVIGTFWTTVKHALELNCPLTFHLCQGYEGDIIEYASNIRAIEDTYRIPIPKLTIGEWLSKRLIEIFGSERFKIYTIGQIVDLKMYKPLPLWKQWFSKKGSQKIRVLVSGLFDASVKAIPDALQAISLLREKGFGIYLTRVSTVNTLERERALADIDEYHCNISPWKMADIYRATNIFIAPSLSHEGFGLPFAEALACGVPSVATAIPSHLSFDTDHDYACFVPEKNPTAIAEAAARIIKEPQLRRRLIKRGIEVVKKKFRDDLVADRLVKGFSQASL
jgi:glycosyltransferase involved in cell wall biosynthesis